MLPALAVDKFVNVISLVSQTGVIVLKSGVGKGFTITVLVATKLAVWHPLFVPTLNVTVYVPAAA